MIFWTCLNSQATAEQIRLAQMISDHNDADFEEKVKQVSILLIWCKLWGKKKYQD